jgi:hypothetical protein
VQGFACICPTFSSQHSKKQAEHSAHTNGKLEMLTDTTSRLAAAQLLCNFSWPNQARNADQHLSGITKVLNLQN